MSNIKDMKARDVKITLNDGVERTLKYDLNALAEMEDRYGTVDAAFAALDTNSIKAVRFVLWAGLIHSDETLTERQVGSLIDLRYLNDLMGTLGKAFDEDLPVSENIEGN